MSVSSLPVVMTDPHGDSEPTKVYHNSDVYVSDMFTSSEVLKMDLKSPAYPFGVTDVSLEGVTVSGLSLGDDPVTVPFHTLISEVCLMGVPLTDNFDTLTTTTGGSRVLPSQCPLNGGSRTFSTSVVWG